MSPPEQSPWLSVLVPVYRVEAYVRECLESVLSQCDDGVEIVVVDDASPDASMRIVQALQQAHPERIRVLSHARNAGISAVRNTLLEAARGRHAWFIDSDDVLHPGAIAALRAVIERDAPDLVLCDFSPFGGRSGPFRRLRGRRRRSFAGRSAGVSADRDALLTGMLESRQMHVWCKIATLQAWRAVRFPEGRYFEDMAVIAQLVSAVRRWTHVPQSWVGYRQRGDSILAQMTPAKSRDLLQALLEVHDGLRALPGGISTRAGHALEYFCLRTFASLARKVPGDEPGLADECRAAIARVFPQGMPAVLAAFRARGWWLRAWRAERSLARRGWPR